MMSRLILSAIGAYFLVTAGYAVAHADLYATGIHRILRYVVGPGVIGVGCVGAALWLPASPRLMSAIYGAALMATLFLFEGLMTWQSFGTNSGIGAELTAQAAGESGFRRALPPNYTLKGLNGEIGDTDPANALLSGFPHQDVLLCRNEAGPVLYRADRYGFRNDDRIHDGPIDVLLLGDSFAEGYCLHDGDHFADQLGTLGPRVMNTGSRGAGPLFELALLDRFGPNLAPPWTVWLFYGGNDWENLQRALPHDWLSAAVAGAYRDTPSLPEPDRMAAAQSVVQDWWTRDTTVLEETVATRSQLRNVGALQKTALTLGLHFPKAPAAIPGYEQIYARAAETVASWGGRMLIVYIPPVEQFVGLMSFPGAYDALPNLVRDAAAQNDIPFLDLSAAFYALDDPAALYAPDAHFSSAGAAAAARLVKERIDMLDTRAIADNDQD